MNDHDASQLGTQTDARIRDAGGGNLNDAIAGRYDFSIGDVIGESWRRTNGLKGPFWLAALIVGVGIVAFTTVAGLVLAAVLGGGTPNAAVQILLDLIVMLIVYPFMAGFMMLGIRRAVDLPIDFKIPFSYLNAAAPIVLAALLMTVLMWLGLMLLIIPGLYLGVAYMFVLPLIIDKDLGVWEAMETSRKAVTKHWFKFFGVMLLLSLLYLVSAFTIVGVIWTYPMMLAGLGVLYRITFGVEETAEPHAT